MLRRLTETAAVRGTQNAPAIANVAIVPVASGKAGLSKAMATHVAKPSPALITLAIFDHRMNPDYDGSHGNLIADASGNLYGTTAGYKYEDTSTVFEVKSGSGVVTTLDTFSGLNGLQSWGGLIADSHGNFFGTTETNSEPNLMGAGTIFEVKAGTGTITRIASFNGATTTGSQPIAGLIVDAADNLYGATGNTVFEVKAGSGRIMALAAFDGTSGYASQSRLVADSAGNLYGTTSWGGAYNAGTVFEVKLGSGRVTALAAFNGTNGAYSVGDITADAAGNLFGTTMLGGASGDGTVFEVKANSGVITTLATFNGVNGANPASGVIADAAGNLFGTTSAQGSKGDGTVPGGNGTVFEVKAGSGVVTTLMMFTGDNGGKSIAGLKADAAGNLFGTTTSGGANGFGTVFELTHTGFVVSAPTVIDGGMYGGLVIQGTAGADLITAHGWNNTINANGGDDVIYAGQGQAVVNAGGGNVVVHLSGYNNVVSGGNGSDTIGGSQGNTSVALGSGNDGVTLGGYSNQVTVGDGANGIVAGDGNSAVSVGNGTNTIALAGYYNSVVGGDGANIVSGSLGNLSASFGNGGDRITAAGYSNHITTGSGADVIDAGAGNATVSSGGGDDQVTVAGWTNWIDAGGGHNALTFVGGGNDTLVLHVAGTDTVSGFSLTSNDVLDIRSVLAESHLSLSGDLSTLGNYLHVTDVGADASVAFDATGRWAGGGSTLVVLQGASGSIHSLADLTGYGEIRAF